MNRLLLPLAAAAILLPGSLVAQEAAAEPSPAAESPDLSSFKTADELWAHIEVLQRGPSRRPTSREDAIELMKEFVGKMQVALDDFLSRFPDDPHKWPARLMLVDIQNASAMAGGPKPDPAKLRAELAIIAAAEDAPGQVRSMARLNMVGMDLQTAAESGDPAAIEAADKAISQFATDFPDHQAIGALKLQYAILVQPKDADKADALLAELEKSANPRVAEQAKALREQAQITKKPLDLEFTAVDGSKVSLADLRGRVVLLDFWATWCGPCVQEVPNVVATYRKLHDKGFEIVGISLDQDKDALEKFTKEHGMTWPQYFDGEGWKNKISSQYGIRSIPAMWLVNKEGYVVNINARANLEAEATALLEK